MDGSIWVEPTFVPFAIAADFIALEFQKTLYRLGVLRNTLSLRICWPARHPGEIKLSEV